MTHSRTLTGVMALLLITSPAFAQQPDIENDVPVAAEATTAVTPGQSEDQQAAQPGKPDRIYTEGALANPNPKAEDLGMASPGEKITVDTNGE